MFFGGSSRFSPTSADSCPPDVSACAGMVGSLGLSPKLSPLFHSEDHAKQVSPARRVRASFVAAAFRPASLVFQVPLSLCLMPPSGIRSSCCKISKMNTCAKTVGGGVRICDAHESDAKPRMASSALRARLCSGGLSRPVPSFEGVSRGLRGPIRRRPWFFGCPICCALCNKWVSGLQHDSAFGLQKRSVAAPELLEARLLSAAPRFNPRLSRHRAARSAE
jgi:hypothetical protein